VAVAREPRLAQATFTKAWPFKSYEAEAIPMIDFHKSHEKSEHAAHAEPAHDKHSHGVSPPESKPDEDGVDRVVMPRASDPFRNTPIPSSAPPIEPKAAQSGPVPPASPPMHSDPSPKSGASSAPPPGGEDSRPVAPPEALNPPFDPEPQTPSEAAHPDPEDRKPEAGEKSPSAAHPDRPQPANVEAEGSGLLHSGHTAGPHAASFGKPLTEGIKLMERLIHLVRERHGTDVHLVEDERPRVRLRGDLVPLEAKDHPRVTRQDIQDILDFALTPDQQDAFKRDMDIDFSLDFRDAMGRVNVGMANGRRLQLALRYLPSNLIPLDDLGIDADMLKKMIAPESGLVIVTGETSSGKTTTIIALLDHINHTRFGSISTIENPVEYMMRSDKCLIARREVGRDTPDFHTALRASVRKNPDVLLIGEIRDYETGTIALSAAETGIQTFCTLHSVGAIPSITRLGYLMVGGGHNENEFFNRLANVLRGIVAQQLVKAVDGKTVLPIYEILNITYTEKNYLRERDLERLEHSLETDRNISIGDCIHRLWHREPRPIDESVVRRAFGDQFNLAMNRLHDPSGWKPIISGMG